MMIKRCGRVLAMACALWSISIEAQEPYFTQAGWDMDWLTLPSPNGREAEEHKGAFCFAEANEVWATAENSGTLTHFDDGLTTWVVGFRADRCESLNVTMSGVALGPDERIFVYSPLGGDVQTFTWRDNAPNGYAQSIPIGCDSLIVEYQSYTSRKPSFAIESVNVGFVSMPELGGRHSGKMTRVGHFNDSQSCEQNASCSTEVADISHSVCRLYVNGRYYASGTLVRNTADDFKPYVLTSAHCLGGLTLKTCVARFGYVVQNCQSTVGPGSYQDIVKATLAFNLPERDITLLLLPNAPAETYRPYWSGWSIDESQQGDVVAVHHPNGDVQKMSVGSGVVASSYTSASSASGQPFDTNSHWRVDGWLSGATEAGSSGCGLFDESRRLIGGLTGGTASCSKPNLSDYFWQLYKSWNTRDANGVTLASLLDPARTGAKQIDGAYAQRVVPADIFNAMPQSVPESEIVGEQLGYVAGNSELGVGYVAERFTTAGGCKIHGVYMAVKRSQQGLDSRPEVVVWADDNGKPGKELYRQMVDENTLKTNAMAYQQLDRVVEVGEAFHVGISIVESTKATEVAGYYLYKGEARNTAHFYRDGRWQTYNELGIADETVNCGLYFGLQAETTTQDTAVGNTPTGISIERRDTKIVMRANGLRSYSVRDTRGRRWQARDGLRTDMEIADMQSLPSGIYLLTIDTKDEHRTFKVLNTK